MPNELRPEAEAFLAELRRSMRDRTLSREKALELRNFFVGRDKPCNLCGALTQAFGVFTPTDSFAKRIGQPPATAIIYPLCRECGAEPDVTARIEAEMLRDLQVQ